MYIAQLLPDRVQAEVIRDALLEFLNKNNESEERIDAAHSVYADLTMKMRKINE